jgi:excisionase family DNA binding protein
MVEGERMLTLRQAAEYLQAHPQTIRRWLREGKIKGTMPGGKKMGYRISEAEVVRVLRGETQ